MSCGGGRTILLTYADAGFAQGQRALADSARRVGFDDVVMASPADVRGTPFGHAQRATLDQRRGGGYWLWKPYLIRTWLDRLGADDVLFYCDASSDGFYRFDRFPRRLVARCRAAPEGTVVGPVIHQHGPLRRWTKRDALLLLDADRPEILERPLLQATWSLWRRTERACALADAWLTACSDPRILTDLPNQLGLHNHDGFVDHRHDQSVLSLIVYRDGLDRLELADTGIFRVMAARPNAEMTHRFLKAPRNAERLLAGRSARLAYWREAIRLAARRRLGRA